MEKVKKSRKKIKVKKSKMDKYIVYTAKLGMVTYNEAKEELSFDANESPRNKCWVLVYVGKQVTALFEKDGGDITSTIYPMFCGTKKECEAEIERLGLIPLSDEEF